MPLRRLVNGNISDSCIYYGLDIGMDLTMDWKLELAARELYVLELANGKFYVGQAKDSNRRIKKHFSGTGS